MAPFAEHYQQLRTSRMHAQLHCLSDEWSVSAHATSIGRGAGCVTWVTDPNDVNQLVPLGLIGELCIEGPIVGRGYLNDEEKTAAVFIEDPTWLLQGGAGHPGRRGRLYKTGDLVRYNEDGSLVFVGRKDAQVKIRGQRGAQRD